jgi:hypothetical protein
VRRAKIEPFVRQTLSVSLSIDGGQPSGAAAPAISFWGILIGGGAVPGSFNVSALDHMAEGLRITPVRVFREGVYLSDVAELIANNTRAPARGGRR